MKLLHQPGEIIGKRYRIINTLGKGGVAITYQAFDLKTNEQVALKALSLRQMNEWKKIELFEREAQILSQLNHPGIPKYLDYFQVDTATDRYFYIAQQLAPGKSLAELVENGWRLNESEVKYFAIKILEILVYLQSLTPPVIHRDIKPQNIIITANKQVFLVDFGAVQDTYYNTIAGGSTIVGTFGYMAPEQCRGQAVLSTDLYGLGTTILFLLTGKSTEELPTHKLKINFRSQVRISSQFANWLEKLLEPAIEDRFTSAAVALAVLQGKEKINKYSNKNHYKPEESKINLRKTKDNLIIEIPSPSLKDIRNKIVAFCLLIWNFFIFYNCVEFVRLCALSFRMMIGSPFSFWNIVLYRLLLPVFPSMQINPFFSNMSYRIDVFWPFWLFVLSLISFFIWGMCIRIIIIMRLTKMQWFNINNKIGFTNIYFTIICFINDILIWLNLNGMPNINFDYHPIMLGFNFEIFLGMILIDMVFVLWFQRSFLVALKPKIDLEITSDKFLLKSSFMNQKKCPKFEYYTELIKPILSFLGLPMGENPISDISLKKKLSKNGFCSLRSRLTQDEKEWLAWEINNYLKDKNINT